MSLLTCLALAPWYLEHLTQWIVLESMTRLTSNVDRKFLKVHTIGHMLKTFLSSIILQKCVGKDERNDLLYYGLCTA